MKEILKYIKLYTGCDDHAIKRITAMLEDKLKPQVIEKVIIVEKYINKNIKPALNIEQWAPRYFEENELTYDQVTNKSRKVDVCRIRSKFCQEAFKAGYGCAEQARYLKRNHTTILHSIHSIKTK
jgi:hypothetical protein